MNVIPLCRISNFMHVMTLDLIKSAYDEYMHIHHSYKSILQGHGAIHLVCQSSSMSQRIFRHLEFDYRIGGCLLFQAHSEPESQLSSIGTQLPAGPTQRRGWQLDPLASTV